MLDLTKNKKKSGFTLGEVLCALGVVGICMALALTTTKPAEKAAVKYLYMNAYNSLQKAYYNSVLLGSNPFTEEKDEETGKEPVHSDAEDSGTEILCKGLTNFINTKTNKKDADKDYSTTCSSTNLVSELGTDVVIDKSLKGAEKQKAILEREKKAQFIASNGMQFYITKMLGQEDGLHFYLVFVDVNGRKAPNSMEYSYKSGVEKEENRIEPDVFAFAILDTGRVCPLGVPEYDSNILTARFAYFDDQGDPLYTKKSMPYYQAKGAAWGVYSSPKVNKLQYNADDPYTMNDAIRALIDAESLIVKDFPDLATQDPKALEGAAPYNCSDEDFESCYIFLDEYRQ